MVVREGVDKVMNVEREIVFVCAESGCKRGCKGVIHGCERGRER